MEKYRLSIGSRYFYLATKEIALKMAEEFLEKGLDVSINKLEVETNGKNKDL